MHSTNFLISIHRQEHKGWQGTIQWLDTGKKVDFRSEIEMLLLIDEATQMQSKKNEKRSWVDSVSKCYFTSSTDMINEERRKL